ncbi:hypothetical protein BUALT_Bualt10G0004000 [Buddleja alternifolia]|uniref:Uncharacterized protein n=1 Tax=Buddleja alternifolia TaxID=168488 RepID=A0AAV6WZS2_9LAMI|nr:hypothetical protein BUALT_Bualt10G0004000 [Buddleja alternifolia]
MDYVLRVKLASIFTGAAVASAAGLYFLRKDYMTAHIAISQQINTLYEPIDGRVSSLEKFKGVEAQKHVEDAE